MWQQILLTDVKLKRDYFTARRQKIELDATV
jgi:hypothetical protein